MKISLIICQNRHNLVTFVTCLIFEMGHLLLLMVAPCDFLQVHRDVILTVISYSVYMGPEVSNCFKLRERERSFESLIILIIIIPLMGVS